jgi:hypothetical protein
MNRFFNVLILFIFFPAMVVVVIVGFDLPLEFLGVSGSQLPYRFEIFCAFAVMIGLVHTRRSVHRWTGMQLVKQAEKFIWLQPVSKERRKRIVVYNVLESIVFISMLVGIALVCPPAWPLVVVFALMAVDTLLFLCFGMAKNLFRIGITKLAVVVADRDVTVAYFSGLRRVHIHQESLFFEYIKGLQLYFPLDCIVKEHEDTFFNHLQEQLDSDKVFVTNKRKK